VRATDAGCDAISLLLNKKGVPLLMAMGGGSAQRRRGTAGAAAVQGV
jgi:hypothetical protein